MATVQKITLVDRGQDFTEWYVRDGIVIDCQPFQGWLWVGTKLVLPKGKPLSAGQTIKCLSPVVEGKVSTLNYPVEAIEELSPEAAAEVEGFGRRWAEIKGITAASLGL